MAIGLSVVLAFALNYLALQDRSEVRMVAVASHDLVAGSALHPTDVQFVSVDASFAGLDSLIEEGSAPRFEGWVLSSSLGAGDLIPRYALVEPGSRPGLRSMSIPVPIEHAAGGSLASGDRVDVVSVANGEAIFVAVDLEVLDAAHRETGNLGSLGSYYLVVAVDGDQALSLAEAIDSGSVEIVRSTGARAVAGELVNAP